MVIALAAILGAGPRSAGAQVVSPRTVLTIHSGAESFPSNPLLDAGIRERLAASDVPIEYVAEYFESDLFPTESATLAFKEYLQRKYQGLTIDVVIAMTDTGLRFVLDYRGELFPDAPIIFFAPAGPDEITRNAGSGVTGITVGVAYAETLKLALALHPATEKVFVVARRVDGQSVDAVRAELGRFSGTLSLTYVAEETLPLLLSTIRKIRIPERSLILYIWHGQAEPGNVVDSVAVARLVAEAATVPVYGTSDLYMGQGVVGGVVRGTRDTGTRLADLALRVLAGTRPQDIPVETAQVRPVIDWRQVQRWNIDPSRIPPGSQIEYREPTVWERYRLYIAGTVTVLLAQAALIGGLVIQRARRRRAERQARQSEAALQTSYDRIRDLGSRLLKAQEDERSRIARELHDDISQQLAVLTVAIRRLGRAAPGQAETAAAEAVKRAEEIGTSVHDLSHRLHPARLRVMGLVDVLNGLNTELSQPGVSCTFTHDGVPPTLPPELTVSLYRIVQEALHNARKHSQAKHVSVQLNGVSSGLALTIVDDGLGFDVEAAWRRGLGLISLRERVAAIGGTFEIRSSPGAGTRIEVNVPVEPIDRRMPA